MKLFGNRRRAAHTKKSALPRGTRTALIAAVIVLAVAGSAFAAWKLLVKPVERPALSEPEPEPPAEEEAPEPSAVPVTPQELEPEQQPEEDVPTEQPKALRDGVYNILICGTDGDGYRTDTIIVAHLDANTHTVALLSIPRDTPVATGGGGLMKINSVYAGGGADGMERLASRLHFRSTAMCSSIWRRSRRPSILSAASTLTCRRTWTMRMRRRICIST